MSRFDDTQIDCVAVSDGFLFTQIEQYGDKVVGTDSVVSAIDVSIGDCVSINDFVDTDKIVIIGDKLSLQDTVASECIASISIKDKFNINGKLYQILDEVIGDLFAINDDGVLHRIVRINCSEKLDIKDKAMLVLSENLGEKINVKDGNTNNIKINCFDSVSLHDGIINKLIGYGCCADAICAKDGLIAENAVTIFTANTVNFAMSRYSADDINYIVDCNGILLKATPNGVFAMIGSDEEIVANIEYGKIDFGRHLTHPVAGYLEYAKDGDLSISVTQTQSGKAESYTYSLPQELADDITNGRVTFGRGLRGRQFSFKVKFVGKYLYLDDLYIDSVIVKRRI